MALNKNTAVFTTKDIIKKQFPILLVIHDNDGDWQFLNGNNITENNAAVISLSQVFEIDASVELLVSRLQKGGMATRISKNAKWRIIQT